MFGFELSFGDLTNEQKLEMIENIYRRFFNLPFKEDLNQELKENTQLFVWSISAIFKIHNGYVLKKT